MQYEMRCFVHHASQKAAIPQHLVPQHSALMPCFVGLLENAIEYLIPTISIFHLPDDPLIVSALEKCACSLSQL